MALSVQKVYEIMSGLPLPGETLQAAVKAKYMPSKALKATAFLFGPAAGAATAQGQHCLLGLTERHFMWTGYSALVKPRKAKHIPLTDIANVAYEPKKNSAKLEVVLRNGKKHRFVFEEQPAGNMQLAQQFVPRLQQALQMGGVQVPQGYAPPQQSHRPPPQQQYSPPPPEQSFSPPPPQQTFTPPAASMIACSNCRQQIEADSKFCEYCGSPVQQATSMSCPNCGAGVKTGARFCASCGTKL